MDIEPKSGPEKKAPYLETNGASGHRTPKPSPLKELAGQSKRNTQHLGL